jgi:hypothetical protein
MEDGACHGYVSRIHARANAWPTGVCSFLIGISTVYMDESDEMPLWGFAIHNPRAKEVSGLGHTLNATRPACTPTFHCCCCGL